jgi:Domain of unknown function (DUF3854)
VSDEDATMKVDIDDDHREHLHRNGISDMVLEGRPYHTVTDEVREYLVEDWGFSKAMVAPRGFVIQRYQLGLEPTYPQIRYDAPRVAKDGKEHKYESPKDSGGILDVHPAVAHLIDEVEIPVWAAENVKAADALLSHGNLAIGFQGVWGWSYKGRPAPAWKDVPLAGRKFFIAFDSDVHDRKDLQAALKRFSAYLKYERDAVVYVVRVPQPSDSKVGVDDHYGSNCASADAADAADAVFLTFSRVAGSE